MLATRRHGVPGLVGRANGGMVVHLGVVIIAVAFAASQSYAHTGEFRLAEGDSAEVGGHTVTYLGLETLEHAEKTEIRARVQVDDDGVFTPSLSEFRFGSQAIGTPSVRVGVADDVYLALQALPEEGGDEVLLRVVVQPLILWLWVGGAVMALGTILAAWPGSRRRPTDPASAVLPSDVERRVGVGVMDVTEAVDRPPRRLVLATVSVVAVVLVAFIVVLATREPATDRQSDSPLIGKVAPPLAEETIAPAESAGTAYDLDLQRGQWVVVNFFATWCTPCITEHPELVEFSRAPCRTGRRVGGERRVRRRGRRRRRLLRGERR